MNRTVISSFLVLLCSVFSAIGQGQKAPDPCSLQIIAIEAALGEPTALNNLAVEFYRGENVPRDYSKAASLWRQAVKTGAVGAHNNLGYLTYYGLGVKQNFAEGIRLWRVAAINGFHESQVHLADAYSDGKYLRPNYIEAYAWATAGKHFASKDDDPGAVKAITEMADEVLNDVSSKLNEKQLTIASRKANIYITRYAPK